MNIKVRFVNAQNAAWFKLGNGGWEVWLNHNGVTVWNWRTNKYYGTVRH